MKSAWTVLACFAAAAGPVRAQTEASWASKECREDLVLVYEGKLAEARRSLEAKIGADGDRTEPLFVMACLLARENRVHDAWECLDRALAAGLPPGRIVAGPREALAPLHRSERYRDLLRQFRSRLVHGPALGQVTSQSASFWVRTAGRSWVGARLGLPDRESFPVRMEAESRPARDFTAVVSVDGLAPDTEYAYQMVLDGTPIGETHRFRTFPREGAPARFTAVFGGGAAFTPDYERMFSLMQERRPRLFLQLGDNVYIDEPETPAVQRYCYYRRQSSAPYRGLVSSTPVYSIWDDHDFGDNDCWGGPDIDVPAWKPSVWSIFTENWNNPVYAGGDRPGCWYDFEVGSVHFFMLDCRYYRTDPQGPNPSMLGPEQLAWLKRKLSTSKGTFKVIASSVPMAEGTKPGSRDTWDGYARERAEIFEHIVRERIEGVMVVAADRHRSDAWRLSHPGLYPTMEFMSSRITNIHSHDVMPASLFGFNRKRSFGHLDFDAGGPNARVIYRVISEDGETVYRVRLDRSELGW